METPTRTPDDRHHGMERCPRCVEGRIGVARLTCQLCFGSSVVQPWAADQERAQQASWARYLTEKKKDDGAPEADPELGECARCWPTRCPQCPWTPAPFDLAA